jgi:protein-S-isoprenylcysteine O-methyltransferase Ste14
MWQAHYVHRAFVYPFSLAADRRMPLVVVLVGMLFNSVNTYLNGRYLFEFSTGYGTDWLLDPRFVVGTALFFTGYVANRYSDRTLRDERRRSGERYCRIDRGIFRYVCCPNYLGEIAIWCGWAMATWSLAGLSFAAWTAANLLPRGRSHLEWSRRCLDEFPRGRRAVLPGLW